MWATAVMIREGYSRGTAISFAKVIASNFAKTRAGNLGLAPKDNEQDRKYKRAMQLHNAKRLANSVEYYPAFGTEVLAGEASSGELRGILADETSASSVDSKNAESFLKSQLGARFDEVEGLMKKIAEEYTRDELEAKAYSIYEKLRPAFTQFGAKSPWDLDEVRRMAEG
jgi:hypothetical protein